jgi:hypothetical protein
MSASNVIWLGGPRSLSGHPLEGSRAVRLAYIDEAGISNVKHEPYLVVCAVLVHADNTLMPIERHFDKLVARYIPSEHQADFVFHAKELFNGGGKVFDRASGAFPLSLRLEIADKLAEMPKKFNLKLAFSRIERATFAESGIVEASQLLTVLDLQVATHVTAFMVATLQIDRWMRIFAPNEVCMLVVEDNQQSRRFILDNIKHHQDKSVMRFADPEFAPFFPLRKIKEEPLFQAKKKSSPMQLADFFAYVFKRKIMGDSRYDRYLKPAWGCVAARDYERPEETQRRIARSSRRRASERPQ